MASLIQKLTGFAKTPQGRRAIEQAKRFASDPKRQQQARDAAKKVRDKVSERRNPPPDTRR